MHQQALNRAHPSKNFYDCPSSEAYSSLTLSAAPWAGLFGRAGGRSLVQSTKFKDQSYNIAHLTGQTFLISGLGDARLLCVATYSLNLYKIPKLNIPPSSQAKFSLNMI